MRIICHHSGGVILRLFDMADIGLGMKEARERSRISLKPGENDVDDAFIDEWMKTNPNHPLIGKIEESGQQEQTDVERSNAGVAKAGGAAPE